MRMIAVALLACAGAAAAQDTRWEVIAGSESEHSSEGWRIAVPKTELKYQWSPRLELGVEVSWIEARPTGAPASSALSAGTLAAKYQLLPEDAGFGFALAPEFARRLSRASVRRGIASENQEYLLGTETMFTIGRTEIEVKAGRNFVERQSDEWAFELKVTDPCMPRTDCIINAERKIASSDEGQTLLRLGVDVELRRKVVLRLLGGREIGPRTPGQVDRTFEAALKLFF
jgi:hypothetical protein